MSSNTSGVVVVSNVKYIYVKHLLGGLSSGRLASGLLGASHLCTYNQMVR
jgi:hypothetical protein